MSPLAPPAYRKTAWIHRRDTRANQPAAADVLDGTLYYVTDEAVTERSDGSTWEDCSDGGTGGGGGGGWVLVDSWTHSINVANVDFTGLGTYSELFILGRLLTTSSAGFRVMHASIDNGSTFYTTSGDYVSIDPSTGQESNTTGLSGNSESTTAARTFSALIPGSNINGTPKMSYNMSIALTNQRRMFVASTSPINALRISNSAGNLTGGSIYVLGRSGGGGSGGGYPDYVAPVDADFAWVNQGSATITATTIQGAAALYLSTPADASTASNLRCRVTTAPATPYTVRMRFIPNTLAESFHACGMLFRESGTGEMQYWALEYGSAVPNLMAVKMASATSGYAVYASGTVRYGQTPAVYGLQIEDTGTNRVCSLLADGQNPLVIHTIGRTDHLTADQIGFFVASQNTLFGCGMTVLSWEEF